MCFCDHHLIICMAYLFQSQTFLEYIDPLLTLVIVSRWHTLYETKISTLFTATNIQLQLKYKIRLQFITVSS